MWKKRKEEEKHLHLPLLLLPNLNLLVLLWRIEMKKGSHSINVTVAYPGYAKYVEGNDH